MVADKCVHPVTKRPYPVTMIEKSMRAMHFSIKPTKNAKQQVRGLYTIPEFFIMKLSLVKIPAFVELVSLGGVLIFFSIASSDHIRKRNCASVRKKATYNN